MSIAQRAPAEQAGAQRSTRSERSFRSTKGSPVLPAERAEQ